MSKYKVIPIGNEKCAEVISAKDEQDAVAKFYYNYFLNDEGYHVELI